MRLRRAILPVAVSLVSIGCTSVSLPLPEEEVAGIVQRLAVGVEIEDAALATDLARFNEILLETFEEAYLPIPEEDLVRYDPLKAEEYSGVDAFRWGLGLVAHPENDKSVGAFVSRPVSVGYDDFLQLVFSTSWKELFPSGFRRYDRIYADHGDVTFPNGESDRAECDNSIEYLVERGIAFEFESHGIFRRIRDASLPGGEAVVYWDYMIGEGTRIEGGYSAYLRFLRHLRVFLPFRDRLSWWLSASWSEAGGSFMGIDGTGKSGDVAQGIRLDFEDLEKYLSDNGMSCLPSSCN
jgi:hypothetical protein